MPILNYRTTIDAGKTAAEIQVKLARAKAQAILTEYDGQGVIVAMSFRIPTRHGLLSFRLPANTEGVYEALRRDPKVPPRLRTKDQAARVAWRVLKDWIEAQLALIEAQLAEAAEVFLAYAQFEDGRTVYETLEGGGFKALALTGPKGGG